MIRKEYVVSEGIFIDLKEKSNSYPLLLDANQVQI
jgi:hypothetical protein